MLSRSVIPASQANHGWEFGAESESTGPHAAASLDTGLPHIRRYIAFARDYNYEREKSPEKV